MKQFPPAHHHQGRSDRLLIPPEVFSSCIHLTEYIRKLSKKEIYATLRGKALKENGQGLPWGKLCHAAGRLLSYFGAVNTLLQARSCWDCLFHEFRVECLPSSTALPNPITRKTVTGSEIIGRMTPDTAKQAEYRRKFQDLQVKFDVNREIQEKVDAKKQFQPIVHAEVLIHQSIVDDPDPEIRNLHPSRFFEHNRYIGSSKPTCRLCDYYFRACQDPVQTRETHRNLYHRWRVPDVYKHQGEEAVARREKILNDMLKWIRDDTFRTFDDKVPERNENDSTDPTNNLGTSLGYAEGWLKYIPDVVSELSIHDTERDDHIEFNEAIGDSAETDDQDDDEGGARL